jgi:tetratricopeptide (TPR) repeat protein
MNRGKGRFLSPLILAALLLLFAFLAITSATRQAPTVDEPVHLLGGYSYLKWGDYRVNPEHPPLVKIWAALPLLGLAVNDPRGSSALWSQIVGAEPGGPVYPLAREMFFKLNDADKLFFYARVQMVAVSLALALFVYLWSRELLGSGAAGLAVFFFALDPNVLAHSPIIHTDMAFAALVFVGTWAFWHASRALTGFNLLLVSLLFGLAAITKHSFLAILPIWLAVALLQVFGREPLPFRLPGFSGVAARSWEKMLLLSLLFVSAAAAAYGFVWAAYGFRFSAVPGGMTALFMTEVSPAQRTLVGPIQWLAHEYHLLPEAFVAGFLYNLKVWKHAAYLLGEISPDGFWGYFPIAFAVKTPLPTLLLSAAALGAFLLRRRWSAYGWLLLPVVVYFALAILSRFNIGIRHLLPIYPFLFVLVGAAAWQIWQSGSRVARGGLALLALWQVWIAASTHPHYLAYFNELAGGPKNGHQVLLDSNLDWGQDLKGLKRWLDVQGIARVQLVYFGTSEPSYYGVDDFYSVKNLERWPASGEATLPEYLAVSANFLYGGELFLPPELAERLRRYQLRAPVASIGHSILVFKVSLDDPQVYEDGAVITSRLGAFDAAEALLRKSLALDSARSEGRYQLAVLKSRQGKSDEAIREYRAVVDLDPHHHKAHFGLANALARAQRFDEAESHYRETTKLRPEFAPAYQNLGRVLLAQGRTDEAVAQFRQALRIQPDQAEVHESLGQALARRGRGDEAARHYREAVRLLKQRRVAGSGGR